MKPDANAPTVPVPPALQPLRPALPLPLVGDVSLLVLARFRRLMAAEGLVVDLPRICVDRLYAFERIALAHTSADARLRALALDLFCAYQREPGPLHLH